VDWLTSKQVVANQLGISLESADDASVLAIPNDEGNLVHQALSRFIETFDVAGGFQCELGKRIPAGAGLGGASSDAASALRCAAALCGIPPDAKQLRGIASSIGSDVPFFLGLDGDDPIHAARATGRGERVEAVDLTTPLNCVVIYPGVTLSTGKVYADSRVPQAPQNPCRLTALLASGDLTHLSSEMMNRLTEPAKKLAPQIDEILESLWRMGLRTCQLTGSGSACFAIASSPREARRFAAQARAVLEPGAIVMATRSRCLPAPVEMT
jgi:4-diphosphocytidyl-2-C-methyl-D-erythritol kinase